MSKRLGLLIVMMLFVTMMTGCFGSDDSSTPTPATTSSVVITGTIPALSAPAGAPNKMVNYGTNYEMGVFNAATMAEITGSAVVINGTTYTATVPAGAANVTALVVIRHKTTGKVVYSAIAGNLPTTTQMSAASVSKVTVSGVNLNGESTALATIAKDKGVAAPSIPVSTSVTTMPATVKSTIDTAVGAATITAIRDAVEAVQTVLNASSVPETVKSSILAALDAQLSNVLNAFVTAVKDASAVITSAGGATTVTVGGTTINSTTTPAQVTDAVNHVTVITVTAVTNPSDIAVANGTAVSAIQFPTTVTVTLSNGTTATKNVVWSTTSTPAYNATVSGTYAFTGTVDGTTLKATVKVNVGIIQLKVATPTFTPAAGTFTAAQSVTIATTTEGATIYYTTDGTEPTTSSSVYASAINVAATTTIKAIATKTGMTTSDVASALYTINISLIPVISAERAVKQANGDIVVTWTTNIVTPTAAKLIVSGDIPNPSYPSVLETVSTTTSHSVTIPAAKLAENSAYTKLVISYVIGEDGTTASIAKSAIIEAAQVVADPVFAPVAGTYTTAQSVTLTCATTGADIYYTTDGSTPNSLSTKYTGAIALSTSATTNFKAIAVKTGMTDSNVVSATYVLNISTTKVLTGIALAKATDTVEAETAYTLPTAKASYDDNSVPADVTVSWVEVLAGGTSAVTLPVNKTTAGTYNFQASYTENGVTKTADFVLVVTAKVPVKTLDSLTVTATPAAPTCVVGGTTNVALKVVANYLTGTVATTEEVTTFTTGSNWAAGVFTTTLTAAGTENIVVSFGGKTANVAVTVTAVPTTLAVTTVGNITTTSVRVTLTTAPTADLTIADVAKFAVLVNGTATVPTAITKYASDLTGKTYTLTIADLTNKEGTLTVNGVAPATKVVTNSEYDFDYKSPSISSITIVDNKHFKVNFSERMDSTTATTIANYTMKTSGDAATDYLATGSGVIAADYKSVTFTTGTTLIPAQYILKVGAAADIRDIQNSATYKVAVNTEVYVTATAEQLVDVNGPAVLSSTYNSGTGVLEVAFDQAIDTTAGKYDITKFSVNTVALTASDTLVLKAGTTTTYTITLSSATKTSVNALTAALTLSLAAGAVVDTVTPTANANVAIANVSITKTTPPVALSATYDESTNLLVVTFDQVVKYSTLVYNTNISMVVNGTTTALSGATIKSTADATTMSVELSAAQAITIETASGTATSGTISILANSAENAAATKNLAQTGVTLTYTQDTAKPTLSSASYNTANNKLTLKFSKPVLVDTSSNVTVTGITIKDGTTTATLDAAAHFTAQPANTSNTDLVFALGSDGKTGDTATITDVAALIEYERYKNTNAAYAGVDFDLTKIYVNIAAGAIKDAQGNTIDAITTTTPNLNIVDLNVPVVNTTATPIDAKTIDLAFYDEYKLDLDATTANTAANYKVYLQSAPTTLMTVSTATLQPDGKTVRLLLSAAHTYAATFVVEASGVKDKALNTIRTDDDTNYPFKATYTSSTTLDTVKPKLSSVVATTVKNGSNDTIVLTFSEAMDQTTATNLANYTIEHPIGTVLALNSSNTTAVYTETGIVTMTLKTINLANGTNNLKVTATPNIKDKAGNALDTSVEANYVMTVNVPVDGNVPAFASVTASAGTASDTVSVNFNEVVDTTAAQTITNYTVESPTGTAVTATATSITATTKDNGTATDYTDDYTQVVIVYPTATLVAGGSITVKNPNTNIKDLAGTAMAAAGSVAGTVADGVAPTISSVSGLTVRGNLDQIWVTYSEAVDATIAQTLTNYAIESPTGTAVDISKIKATEVSYDAATFTVKIKLDSDGSTAYNVGDLKLVNGQTVKVTVNNIVDLASNVITANSAKSGTVNNAANELRAGQLDTPATNAKVTANNKVQFAWTTELLASSITASKFKLAVGATDYPVSAATLDATRKIVTITTSSIIAPATAVKLSLATSQTISDIHGNTISAIDTNYDASPVTTDVDGDTVLNQVTTATATAPAATIALTTDIAAPYLTAAATGVTGRRISGIWEAAAPAAEGLKLDNVIIAISGTGAVAKLTNLKLMYSTDAEIGNADDVQASTTIATGAASITFGGINKNVNASAKHYFYLVSDIASGVVAGNTFIATLTSIDTVGLTTGFLKTNVSAAASCTAITIDATAALITAVAVIDGAVGGANPGTMKAGDKITITFDKAIDPTTINSGLKFGGNVDVTTNVAGQASWAAGAKLVTVNNLCTFNFDTDFVNARANTSTTNLALDAAGKVLTITLTNGVTAEAIALTTATNAVTAGALTGVKDYAGNAITALNGAITVTSTAW